MSKKVSISHDTIVGAFVATVFIGLILFTIVLSGMSLFGKHSSKLYIEFDKVGGLRRHDSVIVRGMPVGQVKELSLRDNGVLVTVDLVQKVIIREGYSIRAESTSLLGGMHLVVDTGTGKELASSAKKPLFGMPPENVMENANELISEVRESLNIGGIRTNIEVIVSDIRSVADTLKAGEGTLGRLLSSDDALYNDLHSTISNINTISARLEKGEGMLGRLLSSDDTSYNQLTNFVCNIDRIGARLQRGEGTIGRLLSPDETPYNQFTNIVASLNTISTRLEKGEGTLGRLLSPTDPIATNLATSIENIRILTERIEHGEGLLGQLMRADGEVTLQVNGLLKDGRDLLDDFRETSPISTFSSIFFGAF